MEGGGLKKYLIGGGIFDAVLVILALLFSMVSRTELIIRIGVAGANAVVAGGWILLGLLAVAGNTGCAVLALRRRKQQRLEASPPLLTLEQKEAADAEKIRAELLKYQKELPALRAEISQALAQMDSMDRKQAKLQEVFARNRVQSLSEVAQTIDETEQGMFRNLTRMINRITIWDPLEADDPARAGIYRGYRGDIQSALARNEELLSMCDKLLGETVSYVDERNENTMDDRLQLQVMTETIQTLRNINQIRD